MGSARRLPCGIALALLLVSAIAAGQGTTPAPAPPPPGGGGAVAPASTGSAAAAPDEKKEKGEIGGFTFSDKPSRRAPAPAPATARPAVRRAGGPQATFPGFEQLSDGGSRLFVQLSQTVQVEQRVAPGAVTYVLKGAHLRVHNDTNALVTVHFNTPVLRARLMPSGSDLLFVVELRSAVTPTFKLQDNTDKTSTLTIDFPKGDFLAGDGNEDRPAQPSPARGTKGATAPGRGAGAPAPESTHSIGNPGPTP